MAPSFPADDVFLTTEEVLAYLQVNLRTIYRLIKAGRIPATRVGRQWRFRKRDIDAWLDQQRADVGSPAAPRLPDTSPGHVFPPAFPAGSASAPAPGPSMSPSISVTASPPSSPGTVSPSVPPAASPSAPSAVSPPRRRLARPRILVVDDEASIREMLAKTLALADYDVETASDGAAALDRLRDRGRDYDLLIADLVMPGMDGLTLIRQVRQIRADLSVIIITGFSTESSAVEAVNLGVAGYLRKPFRIPQVLAAAARALGAPA